MTDNTPMPGTAMQVDELRLSNKEWADCRPASRQVVICEPGPTTDVWAVVFAKSGPESRERAERLVWAANNAHALLSALEDLVDWLESNQRTIDGEFSMDELLAPARTAIATARGGRNG